MALRFVFFAIGIAIVWPGLPRGVVFYIAFVILLIVAVMLRSIIKGKRLHPGYRSIRDMDGSRTERTLARQVILAGAAALLAGLVAGLLPAACRSRCGS